MVPVELLEAAGEWIGADPPHNGRRGSREWKHYWFPLLNFLGEQYDAYMTPRPWSSQTSSTFGVYCWKPCNLKPCEGVKDGAPCPSGINKGRKWVHHFCMDKYSALADEVGGRRCRNCFSALCIKEAMYRTKSVSILYREVYRENHDTRTIHYDTLRYTSIHLWGKATPIHGENGPVAWII